MINRIKPTLNLPFALMGQENSNDAFQNVGGVVTNSNGMRVNEQGLIETVPDNRLRVDYDPVTGECKGLLVEEERENYKGNSEDLGAMAATFENSTLSSNSLTAPDGTLTADKLVDNTATTRHYAKLFLISSTGSGESLTFSFFVKAGEIDTVWVQIKDAGGTQYPNYSFNAVTETFSGNDVFTPTIQEFQNGWWRVAVTFTSNVSTHFVDLALNSASYTGVGGEGMYFWGFQEEVGSFPTSYIPTAGGAVTRTADNVSIHNTNKKLFRPSNGSIFVETLSGILDQKDLLSYNLSGFSNYFILWNNSNYKVNSTSGSSLFLGGDSYKKTMINFSPTGSKAFADGVIRHSVGDSVMPDVIGTLIIGSSFRTGKHVNNHIKSLVGYSQALPDTQMIQLTRND